MSKLDTYMLDYIEKSATYVERAQALLSDNELEKRAYLAMVPETVEELIKSASIKETDRQRAVELLSNPEEALKVINKLTKQAASQSVDPYGSATNDWKGNASDYGVWAQFGSHNTSKRLK